MLALAFAGSKRHVCDCAHYQDRNLTKLIPGLVTVDLFPAGARAIQTGSEVKLALLGPGRRIGTSNRSWWPRIRSITPPLRVLRRLAMRLRR
jgi:hypothetical protein